MLERGTCGVSTVGKACRCGEWLVAEVLFFSLLIRPYVVLCRPIGVTVRDVALSYAVMAGPDEKDPNSLVQPRPHLTGIEQTKGTHCTLFCAFGWWTSPWTSLIRPLCLGYISRVQISATSALASSMRGLTMLLLP